MSVRATSQPIGAATAQQMMADEVARKTVVQSGPVKVGSVISVAKFASVQLPVSVNEKNTSHDIGSTISAQSTAAKPNRIGQEGSKRERRDGAEVGRARSVMGQLGPSAPSTLSPCGRGSPRS